MACLPSASVQWAAVLVRSWREASASLGGQAAPPRTLRQESRFFLDAAGAGPGHWLACGLSGTLASHGTRAPAACDLS